MKGVVQDDVKTLEAVWINLHSTYCKKQRIDVIPLEKTLSTILQQYSHSYNSLDQFIQQSFIPFCKGYLSIDDENVKKQHYPLSWALSNNRYLYYEELGKQQYQFILQNTFTYSVFSSNDLIKEDVLFRASEALNQLKNNAKEQLSELIYNTYFKDLEFKGVEMTIRIIAESPVKEINMKSEIVKYVTLLCEKMGKMLSIRFI